MALLILEGILNKKKLVVSGTHLMSRSLLPTNSLEPPGHRALLALGLVGEMSAQSVKSRQQSSVCTFSSARA